MDVDLSAQFFLLHMCILISTSTVQNLDTMIVKRGRSVNITFYISGDENTNIEMKHSDKVIFVGPKKMLVKLPIADFNIVENVNDRVIFYVYESSRNHAGRYCIKNMEELETEECLDLLIADMPDISLSVKAIKEEALEFFCKATTTTKPAYHHLTMVYRWFIDEQYGNISSTHLLMDYGKDDHIQKEKMISCIVTDDPVCSDILTKLGSNSTLKSVLEDSGCENVLAHIEKDMFKIEYAPLTLESPGQDTLVFLGTVVDIMWKIDGFPKPEGLLITPSQRETTLAKIFLNETETENQFYLTLIIHFISSDEVGTYCIDVTNRKGNITVCHTFLEGIPMSVQNGTSEVELGKKEVITWIITGHPKPELVKGSIQVPTGVDHNFVSVSIVNTSKSHRYRLTMRTPVISQNDLGKYCVDIRNIKEKRRVCQTLIKASSQSLLLPIVFGVLAFSLLTGIVVFVAIIKKRKSTASEVDIQSNQAEGIPLSETDDSYDVVSDQPDDVDGGRPLSLTNQSSLLSLFGHTSLTPSQGTVHSTNQPRNSSSSSDCSFQTNKNRRNSNGINASCNTSKSTSSTNSTKNSLEIQADDFDKDSDYLHAYDSLDPNTKVSSTSNYTSLANE